MINRLALAIKRDNETGLALMSGVHCLRSTSTRGDPEFRGSPVALVRYGSHALIVTLFVRSLDGATWSEPPERRR
jgi:hypothetical protein